MSNGSGGRRWVERWYQLGGYPFELLSDEEAGELLAEWSGLLNTVDDGMVAVRTVVASGHPQVPAGSPIVYREFYLRERVHPEEGGVAAAGYFGARPCDPPAKPAVVEEHPDRLEVEGGGLVQVAAAYAYPGVLPDGFLHRFYDLADEVCFAWRALDPSQAASAVERMRARLRELASDPRAPLSTLQKAQKAEELAYRVGVSARLLRFHLTFTYSAENREELAHRWRRLRAAAKSLLISLDIPRFAQRQLYEYGYDRGPLGVEPASSRLTDTISAQAFYPLIDERVADPEGIYLGVTGDGSPLLWDPWSQSNYNVVILGETGSGKSMTTKLILRRLLAKEPTLRVIGLDPEDEYVRVAQHISPRLRSVRFSANQKLGLDPFRLAATSGEYYTVADAAAFLAELYLPRGDRWEADSARLRAHAANYQAQTQSQTGGGAGGAVGAGAVGGGAPRPSVADFVEWLRPRAADLAEYLAGATAAPDNLIFEGDPPDLRGNVMFGLQGVDYAQVGAGPKRKSIVLSLLALYAQRELFGNYDRGVFFVDEAWLLLDFPATMHLLSMTARRARKYNKCFIFNSQRPYDLAANQSGRTILEQSAHTILLRQREGAIPLLKELYALRDEEAQTLIGSPEGSGILRSGPRLTHITIIPEKQELEYFSTRGEWVK